MIGKTNALKKGGKPEQTKTVEFNLGNNNSMIITPDEGYVLSRTEVSKPSTMLPENIKSGINIGGVIGTFEGEVSEETIYQEINTVTFGSEV